MRIVPFDDQYELAARLYGRSPDDLRARDESQATPVRRWLAVRGGEAVQAAAAWERPDGKLFLTFVGGDGSWGPLAASAARSIARPLRVVVEADASAELISLRKAGFATELTSERFRVPFADTLASLRRAWVPSGYTIEPADAVDFEQLFELDTSLRQDVPGTDGWRGDRNWFREELTDAPPFDRSTYLVGKLGASGQLVGLVRIWRNPSGPRLGLIGVSPAHRDTVIAAALLKQALTAASSWGHGTFVTETSVTNTVIYPRMKRLGAESLGRFYQLVLR